MGFSRQIDATGHGQPSRGVRLRKGLHGLSHRRRDASARPGGLHGLRAVVGSMQVAKVLGRACGKGSGRRRRPDRCLQKRANLMRRSKSIPTEGEVERVASRRHDAGP